MIDPNKKEPLPVKPSEVCLRAFELMAARQYDDAEKLLANNMAHSDDDTAIAVYHSAMGVLFKMKGEYKTAWQHYKRAEKLLPQDPAIKIISARLLIEEFAEYGQAIKKAKKVLELIPGNPVFAHQAYTTMGLAYVRKGDKQKAVDMLEASKVDDFRNFISAKNIDFELVESLLKRGWGIDSCRDFLLKAGKFAESTGELPYVELLDRMLEAFERDYPAEPASSPESEKVEGREEAI